MADNSPTFQRWEDVMTSMSREAMAEMIRVNRPYGTCPSRIATPTLKRWAIVVMSLRDD